MVFFSQGRFFLKDYFLIFLLFFLITLVKIVISLHFHSPWILSDEAIYSETARNILQGDFFSHISLTTTYPPGYPVLLSSIFLLFENTMDIYNYMLILNTIITSSIIFPSYIIIRKFSSNFYSLAGATLITVLPSVVLYNFVVISENLFIPLFMFSLWFIIESFEKNSKFWSFLAGFSVFLLYFTRFMGIAMVIGLIIAIIYHFLSQYRSDDFTFSRSNYYVSISAFVAPFIVWSYYKSHSGLSVLSSGYREQKNIISTLTSLCSDLQSTIQTLSLLLHEMEFLILSSYFIFFFVAMLFICMLFLNPPRYSLESLQEYGPLNLLAIKAGIVYFVISTILLLISTISHMSWVLSMEDNKTYLIFGRYLDPAIPIVILFGLIGLYLLVEKNLFPKKRVFFGGVLFLLISTVFFLLDFPHTYYKTGAMLGIFYVKEVPAFLPLDQFFILFVILVGIFYGVVLYHKKFLPVFVLSIIFFAIITNALTIPVLMKNSLSMTKNNQIADYLTTHSDESTVIFMSPDEYPTAKRMFYLVQFFVKGHVSITLPEKNSKPDYIISNRTLPYTLVAESKNGYKLFDLR